MSDALVIAYKKNLEFDRFKEVSSQGRRRRRQREPEKTYKFPPKTALIFNLYPSFFKQNPQPFIMATIWDNARRVNDIIFPIHYPRNWWGQTLPTLYQNLLGGVQLIGYEQFLKSSTYAGFGPNRVVKQLIEANEQKNFTDEVFGFFRTIMELEDVGLVIEQQRIERMEAAERRRKSKKQQRLQQERLEEANRLGFESIAELEAFEQSLESLSEVQQRRAIRERTNLVVIDNLKELILKNYNLQELTGQTFSTPRAILLNMFTAYKATMENRQIELTNLLREKTQEKEALEQQVAKQKKKNKSTDVSTLETKISSLRSEILVNGRELERYPLTDLQLYKEIQASLDERKQLRRRLNPRKGSKQGIAVLTALGAGWWLGNKSKK
jgi:hypothetical protein